MLGHTPEPKPQAIELITATITITAIIAIPITITVTSTITSNHKESALVHPSTPPTGKVLSDKKTQI